jgi:tripartite-type tricarboxylate transporter receptor subunit TctC
MGRSCRTSGIGLLVLVAMLVMLVPSQGRAEDIAAFYAGKTITFVSGSAPGASYDVGSRLVARNIGRHIPGKPTVVVQNMPGAGSKAAANHLYAAAARDGSAIGMFGRGLYLDALFGEDGIRFDPLKLNWIGSYGRETSMLVSGIDTPFKTLGDVQRSEMVAGTASPGSDIHSFGLMLNALVGTKLKLVSGYRGLAAVVLAMERGEVQGIPGPSVGSLTALRPQWLKEPGKVNFLVQLGVKPHPTLLKGVPVVVDFAKSALDRQALELMVGRLEIAYPVAAPPDVPAERVAALRAAFDAMVKDEAFLADARKLRADVAPVSGAQMLEMIRKVHAAPKEVVARAKAALKGVGK